MATCVDITSASYPGTFKGESILPMEGLSLRPAFNGRELERKAPLFAEHMPGRFEQAFKRYGYERVQLPADIAMRFNLVRNPDAPDGRWAIRQGDDLLLLATSRQKVEGRFTFAEAIHPIQATPEGSTRHRAGPALDDTSRLTEWRAAFPIPTGHDDPREVMAYLFVQIFGADLLGEKSAKLSTRQLQLLDAERAHLPEILGPY